MVWLLWILQEGCCVQLEGARDPIIVNHGVADQGVTAKSSESESGGGGGCLFLDGGDLGFDEFWV